MKSRYVDRERYFNELAQTSEDFYVDYVGRYASCGEGCRVLEVGCGEGGNLLPFARRGCYVAGIDLSRKKIENARLFFGQRGVKGDFECADFLRSAPLREGGAYDVVLVHDVIEHIEPGMKDEFMARVRFYMKDDGIAFFGFPAWQMPFGGHQQICSSVLCRIPFVHLLPSWLYGPYLRAFGEPSARVDELLSIKRSRMSPEKFERLCRRQGLEVAERTLWLISPHYRAKFGLKPRRLSKPLSCMRWLRNFMTTSCFYIVRPAKPQM